MTDILDIPAKFIADVVKFDLGTSAWIFSMFSVFFLSLVLSLIKNPTCRKWFSTLFGLHFSFYVTGPGYFFVILMFMAVYPFMVIFSRRQAAILGSAMALLMLSLGNFYVWYQGLGKSEFSFVFQNMQNFIKIHMTLVNYNDAGKLDDPTTKHHLTARERYHAEALRERPSLLNWFHYHMLMLSSTLGGPPTEYRPFIEFIEMRGDIAKMPVGSNFYHAFMRFLSVLACMAFFAGMVAWVDKDYLIDSAFSAEPFWYRTVHLVAAMHMKMYMMFVGLTSQEANLIASGMSYRASKEAEPAEEYNSIRTVKIRQFEMMQSPSQAITCWNMQVQMWLKYYIYLRLVDRSLPRHALQIKPLAAVFITSAYWHGFYFGYYAFFSGICLLDIAWKTVPRTKLA